MHLIWSKNMPLKSRIPLKIHFVLRTVFLFAELRHIKPRISSNMHDFMFLASNQNSSFSHQKQFLEAPFILVVIILYSSFLYAVVPPLEQIEKALREEFSGKYSLISEMSTSTEIVYELNLDKHSRKGKYDLTVEKGKIYSSRQVTKPEGKSILKNSWNGHIAYSAWSPDSSTGQNSCTSELSIGLHDLVLNEYDNLGLMPEMIFSTYDPNDQMAIAMVNNPLRVFDRVKYEEKTGAANSKIFLEETTYKGRNLIKMSLRFVIEPLKARLSGPLVEHILDPKFNYRAVETRRYNRTGLTSTMIRNFARDNTGNIILVSAEERRSVLSQNVNNSYPKEDNDKVAVINRYEFETYKVNEKVDPAVYESENVFIAGFETWDMDKKVIVDKADQWIVKIGDQSPVFTAGIATGGQVTPADLEGKVAMLQFTASWCGVCREEMPHIEKDIWQKYKGRKDFVLLGIDRDEDRDKVIRFGKDVNVTYPLVLDPGSKIFHLFAENMAGVTRNVIIDRTGKIVFMTRGFKEEEFEAMKDVIDGLLR